MRVGLFLLLSLVAHLTAGQWLDWRTSARLAGAVVAEPAQAVALPRLVTVVPPAAPEEPLVEPQVATPAQPPRPTVVARSEPSAVPSVPRNPAPVRAQPTPQPPAVDPVPREQTPVAEAAPVEPATSAAPVQASPPVVEPSPAEPVEVVSQSPRFREPPAAPVYPAQARRRNQQGRVLVEVRLDAEGGQRERRLVQSSGFSSLDRAALEAVAGWKFQPELQAGRALPSRVQIPIDFALNTRR